MICRTNSRKSALNFTNRRQPGRARRPDHNQARKRSRAVGLNKALGLVARSEERRVGKEWRSGGTRASSRRRHTRYIGDWSSDVCSSDLIEKNDTEAMKRAYDDLQNKFQEVSAELYKQASAGAGPQAGPQPGPEAEPRRGAEQGAGARGGNGDVVDAEFEVVDEDKKK